MLKKRIILVAAVILCSFCGGCSSDSDTSSASSSVKDVFAMDTYMNLKAFGKNSQTAVDEAADEIVRLEEILSVTNDESDVSLINNAGGKYVSVNEDTLEIIKTACEIGEKSNGALDITVYPVLREWGFTTGDYKIPDSDTLAELLENVDYSQIKIDGDSVEIPDNFQIDLGALAKGYTGDKLMEIFRENGIESAVISLGGNVQTLGRKTDGELWKVAVTDPFNPDDNIGVVSVEDKAVITSGNYERYFIGEDGNTYWHIIDASDGYPADNGLVSVTIIGSSGILCDALSTALFVEGFDGAVDFWQSGEYDFDMILVTDDDKIYITDGISDAFQPQGSNLPEVISNE
jgi:thiamine biosynthesis lipoprotein